jgi:hypothetical protein
MTIHTQAQIVRAVKAALKPAAEMGLRVTGYKVTFSQGVPSVEVTTASDSIAPAPVVGGIDVEKFQETLQRRADAARRS